MCHLILAMPLIALPMLWLLPLGVGLPLYGVVLALAIVVYVMTFKAMRRPVTTGAEALMNAVGTVRSVDRDTADIWVVGEHWFATCAHSRLAVGDSVEVIGREGLTLHVRRRASPAMRAEPPARATGEIHEGKT